MRILVSGNPSWVKEVAALHPGMSEHLGVLHIPRCTMYGFKLFGAADNGAFTRFEQARYMGMLYRVTFLNVAWVTCPDKVGDAKETLRLFKLWHPVIASYKLQAALVAQDGIENTSIPWDSFRCLFVGGSTSFKYSKVVIDLISEARSRGKLIHIGRVNSAERIQYFYNLGVHSFDGSWYAKDRIKLLDHLSVVMTLKQKG